MADPGSVNLERATKLADWARRKKGLVAGGLLVVCGFTGWVWVVVLDRPAGVIDGSRPGHLLGLILVGAFLLFLGAWGAYLAAHALAVVAALVVGVARAPIRIGRWVATNGVRGMAGHGVRVVAVALGVAPLFLFSRLTGVGSFDLAGLTVVVGLAAFVGGMVGAAAVAAAGFVASLASRGAERAVDPFMPVGAGIGALIGAYANQDELFLVPLAASTWGAWVVILVALGYIAGLRLLYRTAREVRLRAGLFPMIGSAAPLSGEAFWSPVPILAWRVWAPANRGLLGTWGTVWRRPRLKAYCHRGRHLAPDWHCTCGIYGLKSPPRLEGAQLLGLVEFSGKVIEHEDGYRAQHATIKRLWWNPGAQTAAHRRMLSKRFEGIPIEVGQPGARHAQQEDPWER